MMIINGGSFHQQTPKRRRFTHMDTQPSKNQAMLAAMKERYGREIHVFQTPSLFPSSNVCEEEEADDFYEFTAEDYLRLMATKIEDKVLKTQKIREAEKASRRSRISKAVIRVRFPDNHTIEATFHPTETIQSLIDLLTKVIAQPDQSFHIYSTPPKKLITNMSQDFYTAGFCPGAILHFSYNVPKGDNTVAEHIDCYLHDEILSLKGLNIANDQEIQDQQFEPVYCAPSAPFVQECRPALKKNIVKPKWLKM